MMNDLNIPFFRKTMFAGMATLFLSTGVTQANPVSAGEEVTEKHAAALPLQKKVTITGVVKDALGPVVGANVVEKGTTNGDGYGHGRPFLFAGIFECCADHFLYRLYRPGDSGEREEFFHGSAKRRFTGFG